MAAATRASASNVARAAMRYHRRRGWEIPASETTPESIFLNRRAFVAGSAAALTAVALPRRARADFGRSDRRALSGQAQPRLYARPRRDARGGQPPLQQLLRIHDQQARRRRRAENAAVDGDDRRAGREEGDHRRRRPGQGDRPRGAALPPPLRRSVVDGDPVDRLSAARAGRAGEAAVGGEIRALRELPRRQRSPPASASSCPGPISRA